jgi:hypothetical protein
VLLKQRECKFFLALNIGFMRCYTYLCIHLDLPETWSSHQPFVGILTSKPDFWNTWWCSQTFQVRSSCHRKRSETIISRSLSSWWTLSPIYASTLKKESLATKRRLTSQLWSPPATPWILSTYLWCKKWSSYWLRALWKYRLRSLVRRYSYCVAQTGMMVSFSQFTLINLGSYR